jgi:hypothetical protein
MDRSRVDYAMAAAIVAAIASMFAIRGTLSVARTPTGVVASATTLAPHESPTKGTEPAAPNRGSIRFDGAGTLAYTPQHRRDLVLSELLARLVSHDAPAAARIAEGESVDYTREAALRVVAQSWARRDAVAALNWVASLSDQHERDAALENAALELAVSQPQLALKALDRRQNPADAARMASTAFSADAQRIDALSTIAHLWGARDPTAVRDLALTLDAKAQQRVRAELALLD